MEEKKPQPGVNSEKQETKNMETHAHDLHKAPGHGWKHYFFEFFMLFLAVFCGFIAENIREHYVENNREKEYMKSMVEDLRQDTAEINQSILFIKETVIPSQKKSLSLVYLDQLPDSIVKLMYETVPRSIQSVTLLLQDRTTQQLKNSGSLRLVKNSSVTDSLAAYWYICDVLRNELFSGYEKARQSVKEIVFSLFSFDRYEQYTPWSPLKKPVQLSFLSTDKMQFKKLGNYISNMQTQLSGPVLLYLEAARKKATSLIELIDKEYHFDKL